MIRIYKKSNLPVSKNFKVHEFACKNGNKTVKIDLELVRRLQLVRDYLKTPLLINSAYRTPSHNKRVGGNAYSLHLWGKAVDLAIPQGVTKKQLEAACRKCGLYVYKEDGWVHADTRYIIPDAKFPIQKRGSKGEWTLYIQHMLTNKGFKVAQDGKFGKGTRDMLKAFQKRNGLKIDGVCGNLTYKVLVQK